MAVTIPERLGDTSEGMVAVLKRSKARAQPEAPQAVPEVTGSLAAVEIPSGDPLETFLIGSGLPVDLNALELDSKALDQLREAGAEMAVPLVAQGQLLGAMYLGSRLSDQPYSTDDRKLLASLAAQVAPQMQVARLVGEQQAEAKERERIQQELALAALIQQTLLPRELPDRLGWRVDAFYRPARSVGGDFYDFIDLSDGRLGVTIGDVTDKGVPAALVMATCRSMLRSAAMDHDRPGPVLAEVNATLVDEIPPAMFVTCLYAIVDTATGSMTIANAGHNLPYIRTAQGVVELRATGMPLGLMKGMTYEERSFDFDDDDVMVLTSDGITEAHDPAGEMYGFSRLMGRVASVVKDGDVLHAVIADLERHTGPKAEQEDDITLVTIRRTSSARTSAAAFEAHPSRARLAEFVVPSLEGNERIAIDKVVSAVADLELDVRQMEKLKTAVGESVMNAIEHGNGFDPSLDVAVSVDVSDESIFVQVSDHGKAVILDGAETPDLEAKLAGEQSPRGWGLFLIGQMVDQVNSINGDGLHTIELVMHRGERS